MTRDEAIVLVAQQLEHMRPGTPREQARKIVDRLMADGVVRPWPTSSAADPSNWELVCRFPGCHQAFHQDTTVGVLAAHWNGHVGQAIGPPLDAAVEDKPHMDLVWRGLGPAPQGRPS